MLNEMCRKGELAAKHRHTHKARMLIPRKTDAKLQKINKTERLLQIITEFQCYIAHTSVSVLLGQTLRNELIEKDW